MKRVLVGALVATMVIASPAMAGPKKKKAPPKPRPVPMTMWLHGSQTLGEAEGTMVSGAALTMNATKPTGTQEKSYSVPNYAVGPNTECASNALFPFWEGPVSGSLTGAYNITLHTAATPGSTLRVRLFDSPGEIACDDDYPAALLDKTVTVPQGNDGKVTLTGAFTALKEVKSGVLQLALTFTGDLGDASQVRVFYDATTADSSVAINCLPKVGKKTC